MIFVTMRKYRLGTFFFLPRIRRTLLVSMVNILINMSTLSEHHFVKCIAETGDKLKTILDYLSLPFIALKN